MSFAATHANGVAVEEQLVVQASMESSDRTRLDSGSPAGETNRLDDSTTKSNAEGILSDTSSMVNAAVAAYEEVAATMPSLPTHIQTIVEPVAVASSSVASSVVGGDEQKCADLMQRCPPPSSPTRQTTEDTTTSTLSSTLLGKRKLPPPPTLDSSNLSRQHPPSQCTMTVSVSSSSSATIDTTNTAATTVTTDFVTTNTATTDATDTTSPCTQEETGLKLLFAASLLQQQNAQPSSSQDKPLSSLQHQQHSATSHLPPPAAETAVSRPSLLFADTSSSSWSSLTSSTSSSSPHLVPNHHQVAVGDATRTTTAANNSSSAVNTTLPFADAPANLTAAHPTTTLAGTPKEENVVVKTPTASDVLCGRGGLINKHQGNIAYRRVVDYNKAIYKQVPKRHRILVSRSIVQTIQNHGGRFLQQTTATTDSNKKKPTIVWTCIPMRRAVQKTSQALREPVQTDSPQHAMAATAAAAVKSEGEKKMPLKSC